MLVMCDGEFTIIKVKYGTMRNELSEMHNQNKRVKHSMTRNYAKSTIKIESYDEELSEVNMRIDTWYDGELQTKCNNANQFNKLGVFGAYDPKWINFSVLCGPAGPF